MFWHCQATLTSATRQPVTNLGRCPTGFTFYGTCFFLCGHCSDLCESPSSPALLNRYDNKFFIASRRKHRQSLCIHDLASALHSETGEEEQWGFLVGNWTPGAECLHPVPWLRIAEQPG